MIPDSYPGEPALAAPSPRRVRVTSNSWISRILLYLCFLIVMLALLAFMHLFVAQDQALRDQGKTIYARVISKNIHLREKGTDSYLFYKYKVGGTVHIASNTVGRQQYDATKIGSQLLITYLPEAPTTTSVGIVTDKTVRDTVIGTMIIPIFFGSIFLLVIVVKESAIRSQWRLLRDGTEAQAMVASKRSMGGWSWQSPARYWITCNFYADQQATSNEFLVPLTLYNAVTPGASLSVLYLPKRPQVNALYRTISDVIILS